MTTTHPYKKAICKISILLSFFPKLNTYTMIEKKNHCVCNDFAMLPNYIKCRTSTPTSKV